MVKKRGRKRKRQLTNLFFISLFAIIVTFSFLVGIILGAKKGRAQNVVLKTQKTLQVNNTYNTTILPTANVHVPILVYHYVEFVKDQKDSIRKSLNIVPPIFESQLKTLINSGYNFITASDLGQYLDGKKSLPPRPIVITFDDGYEDFYTDVFPILKKYHVVVTAYIISGVLGKPNYMTLDEVNEIAKSGLVEIGAHTVDHKNLKSIQLDEARVEIEKSREDLEKSLGIQVVSFAYPYGSYDNDLAQIVKKAGYTNAVTTKGGHIVNQEDRYTLFRIHPGIAVGDGLLREL